MQILDLIEKEQDVLPYLKTLKPTERKKLIPTLKMLWKHQHDKESKQYALVLKALFSCMTKTELTKLLQEWQFFDYILSHDYVYEILPWLKPKWYSDTVNKPRRHYIQSYPLLLHLHENGYVKKEEYNTAAMLSGSISDGWWGVEEENLVQKIQQLEQDPITLKEHIWYIFSEWEVTKVSEKRIRRKKEGDEEYDYFEYLWEHILRKYISEGKIDRMRVLSECLKSEAMWFYELFFRLEPNEEEILQLQDELFDRLRMSETMNILKTIITHDDFDYNTFFNKANLNTFDTISRLNPFLVFLEKIAKKNKEACPIVCLKAAEILSFQKEKIQTRAAKVISKYGDPSDEALSNDILLSADLLLSTSKEILKDFVKTEDLAIEESFEIEQEAVLSKLLPQYKSFDDMLFFINATLKSHQCVDHSLALNLLPKLYHLIDKNNVSKLEVTLITAMDITYQEKYESAEVLAFYLYYIGDLLKKKYPNSLPTYQEKYNHTYADVLKGFGSNEFYTQLSRWNYPGLPSVFIFLASKKILEASQDLDILSTPTHHTTWIDPNILVHRLNAYEETNFEIDPYDLQLAMERLPYMETPKDIKTLISTLKNKEVQQIFQYHYSFDAIDKAKIKTPKLWIPSVLKNKDESTFKKITNIDLGEELALLDTDWDYTKDDGLIFKKHDSIEKENFLKSLEDYHVIDTWHLSEKHVYPSNLDLQTLLFLTPNRPQYFLRCLGKVTASFDKPNDIRKMQNILMAFDKLWLKKDQHDNMYLFLAWSMLFFDNVTKALAAELWIGLTAKNLVDNQKLGEVFAKLISYEVDPLKRFSDLAISDLLNVSQNHNKQLLIFLESCFAHIESGAIKGFKKVLEVFYELATNTKNYKISDATLQELEAWQSEVKSLGAIIKKIKKNIT